MRAMLLGLALVALGSVGLVNEAKAETPPTWLSRIIQPELETHYFFQYRRVDAIVDKIVAAPQAKGVQKTEKLYDAVRAGLHAAEVRQHEIEKNPKIMTGSPSHEAARVIGERMGFDMTQP